MAHDVGREHVVLRDARSGGLDDVAELLVESYAEFADFFPSALWAAYRRELTAVRSRLDAAELIVAVRTGELVGTVSFYPEAAADGHGWPEGLSSLRLLAVRPRMRGLGIGRRLVEECMARARRRGASALGLHTAPFMRAANRLYEAVGFVRAPEFDFDPHAYYADGSTPCGSDDRVPALAYVAHLDGGLPDRGTAT